MSKPEGDWSVIRADLFGMIGAYFLDAWLLMLVFGVLHASASNVPAFGYWQCLFLAVVVIQLVGTGGFNIYQRVKSLTPLYGKKTPANDALTDLITKLNRVGKAGTN